MRNKIFLAAIPAISVSCGLAYDGERPAQRPNIIHIMTDDHSFQTISAYGSPISALAPTPNIDRLAAKGVLFRSAYVENSLSTPSRACLMTGLYSHQNGQKQLDEGIDTSLTFISQILKEEGYQTGIVGKWHMKCEPKGFDDYHIMWDQGEYYSPSFRSPKSEGKYIEEDGYVTDLITDHAIEFLENRDEGKPFCLFVHHKAPHRNWMPPIEYLDLYEDVEFPYPETFNDDYSTRGSAAHKQEMTIAKDMGLGYDLKVRELNRYPGYDPTDNSWIVNNQLNRMNEVDRENWIKAYEDKNIAFLEKRLTGDDLTRWKYQRYLKDYLRCIKSVDDSVGEILDYLEANGLADNTIVVYTSDQGFYMGEHGWFDKRFMYEESFRTPLIISYPPISGQGIESSALVQNIDFAPTYLSVAGIDVPENMVGRSLVPVLKNKGKAPFGWRKYLYYHYYDYPAVHNVSRHDGISDGRYKLIHFYGPDGIYDEFYDLRNDPIEVKNLIDDKDYSRCFSRFRKQLDKKRLELGIEEY
jgi:arylsulfatase A-like enzyme